MTELLEGLGRDSQNKRYTDSYATSYRLLTFLTQLLSESKFTQVNILQTL